MQTNLLLRSPKGWLYLVLPVLAMVFALCAIVAAEDRLSTEQIEERLQELQSAAKDTRKRYEKQLGDIEKLEAGITEEKRKRSGRPGRKLSNMLRRAQEHTLDAEESRQHLDTLQVEVAHYREQLRRRYSTRLREILQKLEETPAEKQRSGLLQRLAKTLDTWDKLQEPQSSASVFVMAVPFGKPELGVDQTDGPAVILAKSDLARDHADWLRARVYQVEVRLGQMQSEQELRLRLGAFADEIALFDSVPTVRVPPPEEQEVFADDDKRSVLLDAVEPPTETQEPPRESVESAEAEIGWISLPEIDRMDLASQIAQLHKYQAQLSAKAMEYETLAQDLQRQAQKIRDAESQKDR